MLRQAGDISKECRLPLIIQIVLVTLCVVFCVKITWLVLSESPPQPEITQSIKPKAEFQEYKVGN